MRYLALLLPIVLSACNSVFYQGDRKRWHPPEDFHISCTRRPIVAADGTQLMTMFCPAKGKHSRGILIQFHGNAQNMNAHYRFLSWLIEEGYSLTTFDYRGYGESGGESSRDGIRMDAQAFVREVRRLYATERRIFYGQSLGGAVMMRALIDEGLREDETYIFEGTFLSYRAVARTALASRWFLWPLQPLSWVLITDTHAPNGDAAVFAGKRVILIHGEADPVVPISHGENISRTMQQPLWRITNGKHLDTWQIGHGRLRRELLRKLQE
jgi:alpha-beta hydrolase superfamily lysophospholipase